MLLHISNAIHLGYVLVAWALIILYIKRTSATRFRATLRLLQIIPVMFALDMIIGILVIDYFYDAHASAGWVSKSAMIYPAMFLAAVWFMFRARRQRQQS